MVEGRQMMTFSYQFLSEAVVMFFLLFPVAHLFSLNLSFFDFIILALVAAGVFIGSSKRFKSFIPLLFSPILLVGLGVLLGIHWVLGILIIGSLVWRYLTHEKDTDQSNERFLLLFTTLLAFVELLFFRELELVVALVTQFILILLGYSLSHYFQVSKRARRSGKKNITLFFGLFLVGSLGIVAIFQPLRFLVGGTWGIVSLIFLQLLKGGLSALQWLGIDLSKIKSIDRQQAEILGDEKGLSLIDEEKGKGEFNPEAAQNVADSAQFTIVFLMVLGIAILLFVMYRMRKRREVSEPVSEGVTYRNFAINSENEQIPTGFGFQRSKAEGPIRKHFLQFERFAQKQGFGREMNESIEDWFERIDLQVNRTSLYQKVRYGNAALTNTEQRAFYEEIRGLKEQMKQKNNQ